MQNSFTLANPALIFNPIPDRVVECESESRRFVPLFCGMAFVLRRHEALGLDGVETGLLYAYGTPSTYKFD